MYDFKIYESLTEELEILWIKLEKKSNKNFFQSFDYIKSLVELEKNLLRIVVVFTNNEPVAIFPFEIKNYFIFKVLQWIGTKKSDLCNPIILQNVDLHKDKDFFINTWNNILSKIGKFDLIFFNNQPEKIQKTINPFVELFNTYSFSKIYQIYLPNNFQSYINEIKLKNKAHHYELHRTSIKLNKLEENFNVTFEISDAYLDKIIFKNVIQKKIDQLELKNNKHNLDLKFIKVYENLIKKDKGKYFLFKIKVNNKIISSCFAIIFENTFYYYIPMLISNEYNNFKPGKILIIKLIKWCFENKIKIFDFGLGEENYKKHFSNYSLNIHKYIYYRNLKGYFLFLILKLLFFCKTKML